jgi:hypothetical protein
LSVAVADEACSVSLRRCTVQGVQSRVTQRKSQNGKHKRRQPVMVDKTFERCLRQMAFDGVDVPSHGSMSNQKVDL